jgi:hypothetical protein
MNELSERVWPLAEAAMEFHATSIAGLGTLAVAALITGELGDAPGARRVLVNMARAAGFDLPAS